MLKQAISLLFSIISLIVSSFVTTSTANSNIYIDCSPISFASMTPYDSNVNSLFSSLADSASLCNFNTFGISPPGNSQYDAVYGLFQCRGDLNSTECKDCVADSLSQLKTTCPFSTGGTIQLEGCLVKYDNTSFFGIQDKMEVSRKCGPSGVGSNSDVLNNIDVMLANLVSEKNQYFRKGDVGSIQGVAQCVQDLKASDCQDCLSEASGRLRSECEASTWGNMYLGKCYIKYATENRNSKNNCNNCCNQKGGDQGAKTTIIQSIGAVVNTMLGGAVSYFMSKYLNKEVTDKVHKVQLISEKARSEVEEVKQVVVVEKEKKEKKRKMKAANPPAQYPHVHAPYQSSYRYKDGTWRYDHTHGF